MYLVFSLPTLLAARLLHGFGAGGFSHLIPVMLYEISPPRLRGRIGFFFQITVELGILLASLLGFSLPSNVHNVNSEEWLWRAIIFCPICIGVIMLLLFSTIYRFDTPAVYLKDLNIPKARKAL